MWVHFGVLMKNEISMPHDLEPKNELRQSTAPELTELLWIHDSVTGCCHAERKQDAPDRHTHSFTPGRAVVFQPIEPPLTLVWTLRVSQQVSSSQTRCAPPSSPFHTAVGSHFIFIYFHLHVYVHIINHLVGRCKSNVVSPGTHAYSEICTPTLVAWPGVVLGVGSSSGGYDAQSCK